MGVTIKDVARRANVSPSTVSRVFTGSANVSPANREAVLKAAKELNFKPNHMARSLKLNQTKTFGLLIPDISNPYYAQLARNTEIAAREHGYSLLLADSNEDLGREKSYLQGLIERMVDGVILATVGGCERHVEKAKEQVPIVTVGRRIDLTGVDSVFVDNEKVGYLAAEHLIELGHRSFAVIAGNVNVSSTRLRLQGFMRRLNEEGLSLAEEWIQAGSFSLEAGERMAGGLFAGQKDVPTGLFCFNDQLAIGAIKALKRMGYRVPGDISVVGCDNTYIATVFSPELSTINRPIDEMGSWAVRLLVERTAEKRKRSKRIELPPTLVVRSSTRRI